MNKSRKDLIEKIMGSIGELHRCFATSRDSYLAQFKLNRPQLELLFSLKHGPRTTGELARQFSVSSSAVSQMVDQLERKKLVERSSGSKDRRVTNVSLAPDAKAQFVKLRNQFIEHLSGRFTDIDNTELESLLKVLTKTVDHLEKEKIWKK